MAEKESHLVGADMQLAKVTRTGRFLSADPTDKHSRYNLTEGAEAIILFNANPPAGHPDHLVAAAEQGKKTVSVLLKESDFKYVYNT